MNQGHNDPNKELYQRTYLKIHAPDAVREHILQMADREQESAVICRPEHSPSGTDRSWLGKKGLFNHRKLSVISIAVAALIVCSLLTYATIHYSWSRVDKGSFGTEPDSYERLVELGFSVSGNEESQSMTIEGVTIRPSVVITDGNMLYLSFLIEGYEYDFGDYCSPKFAVAPDVSVIDSEGNKWSLTVNAFLRTGGFFEGSRQEGAYGITNRTIDTDNQMQTEYTPHYRNADGNLEYRLLFSLDDISKGNELTDFFSMQVHVEFHDLGAQNPLSDTTWSNPLYGDELGFEQVIEGTWILDMETPDGEEAVKHFCTYEVSQKAEGSSWVIDTVTLSPVSARMTYHLEETESNKQLKNIENDLWIEGIRLEGGQKEIFRNHNIDRGETTGVDPLGHVRECYMILEEIIDPEKADGVLVDVIDSATWRIDNTQRSCITYEFQ